VFRIGEAPGIDAVAAQYGATVVECEPVARLAAWSKSIVYRAAQVLGAQSCHRTNAEFFLALDADCLVRAPLPMLPPSGQVIVEQLPAVAAVIDGNGVMPSGVCAHRLMTYAKAMGLPPDLVGALGLDGAAGLRGPAFNDGVLLANKEGLRAAVRWMEDEISRIWWILDHFDHEGASCWWNQVIFNASVHRQHGLYWWLSAQWNAQMHAIGDGIVRATGGKMLWGGSEMLIQHFTGSPLTYWGFVFETGFGMRRGPFEGLSPRPLAVSQKRAFLERCYVSG
jgi:hypothetical protein